MKSMTEDQINDALKRAQQFRSLQLPGQPMAMHMGTSNLVRDLENAVRELRHRLNNETSTITPRPLRRIDNPQYDQYGFWTHPDFPDFGEDGPAVVAWLLHKNLEWRTCEMEHDAPELFEAREDDPSILGWQPSQPPGEGWFLLSIHDTDDGPLAIWVREAA